MKTLVSHHPQVTIRKGLLLALMTLIPFAATSGVTHPEELRTVV
jgi:hypothetical protein